MRSEIPPSGTPGETTVAVTDGVGGVGMFIVNVFQSHAETTPAVDVARTYQRQLPTTPRPMSMGSETAVAVPVPESGAEPPGYVLGDVAGSNPPIPYCAAENRATCHDAWKSPSVFWYCQVTPGREFVVIVEPSVGVTTTTVGVPAWIHGCHDPFPKNDVSVIGFAPSPASSMTRSRAMSQFG